MRKPSTSIGVSGVVSVALCVLALGACSASKDSKKPAVENKPKPTWIERGTGVFDLDGQMTPFGVGECRKCPESRMPIELAHKRAKAKLFSLLRQYNGFLGKQYSQTLAGDEQASEDLEQAILAKLKADTFNTEISVLKVIRRDSWRDPVDGSSYVLCAADLKSVPGLLKALAPQHDGTHKWLEQNALKFLEQFASSRKQPGNVQK